MGKALKTQRNHMQRARDDNLGAFMTHTCDLLRKAYWRYIPSCAGSNDKSNLIVGADTL